MTMTESAARLLADVRVVDLAHAGADVPDLLSALELLPSLEPDVIVVYAGADWAPARHSRAHLDLLATAVRRAGYPGLRRTYLDRIIAPGVDRALDRLADVAGTCRAEVVIAIESDPVPLPPGGLVAWTRWCARAETALGEGDIATVLAATARMRELDRGTIPVTGRLCAAAADTVGGRAAIRAAIERSRDQVRGLLAAHTPWITAAIREMLLTGAARRGFHRADAGGRAAAVAHAVRSQGCGTARSR